MRVAYKFVFLALLLAAVWGFMPLENRKSTASREVFIKFAPEVNATKVDSLMLALGLTKIKYIKEINVEVFEVSPEASVNEVVKICSSLPWVVYAEPTAQFRASSVAEEVEPGSATASVQAQVADYAPGEVLVKFRSTISAQSINTTLSNVGIQTIRQYNEIGVRKCTISGGKSVLRAVEECNADPNIEYAEPNYIYHRMLTPNDPRFPDLYGMTIIDAPQAWDKETGSKAVIVGVIDTGVDRDHDDLEANMWTNPGESGGGKENNNIDDDANGFVDDFRGWDFVNNDNNAFDDNQHGTHVSGTIGAAGNNSLGVVGVNWDVTIMPLKFLDDQGSGDTGDAVEAIIYGTSMGAQVLSNSWGGGGRSQALEDAVKFANNNGVIFVAAAGNNGTNNDTFPSYPASYVVDNVIAVAASNSSDGLASFSNTGRRSVHLAAPGDNILSTVPANRYDALSGTSMATPHVSGASALVWAQFPNLSMRQVIIRVLGGVDRNANFMDELRTGGRLNVDKALSTNPIIANTTRLGNTLDEAGPYVVESDILDNTSVQSATLTYQVSGQNSVSISMASTGSDHYRAEIPGQSLGSTVTYFVAATDSDGNMSKDSNFTFSIAEPPANGCGCGKPPIDLAIKNSGLRTTLNAVANISFFLLPIIVIKFHSNRKKKR